MRRLWINGCMAALLLSATLAHAGGECCDSAKVKNAWCEGCKVGFFADISLTSQKLHGALSAAKMNPESLECGGCRVALEESTTCCDRYFTRGYAYKSRFAADLARGKRIDVAKLECEGCKTASGKNGWCEGCSFGLVGNYSFKDQKSHAAAVMAHAIIKKANDTVQKCESCAIAMVTDGSCATCDVSFRDGKKMTL